MNWNDLGRQIDMLIGMTENSIHEQMQARMKEIIRQYESLVSNYAADDDLENLNKYNRLNKLVQQIETDITSDYTVMYHTIAYAQALSFIHSFLGSAFLLSKLTGIMPLIGFPALSALRKILKQDTKEFDLLTTLQGHKNDMLREIKGALKSSVNDDIKPADTKRKIKRITDKYISRVQTVSTHEIGRAESIAEVEIGEQYTEAIESMHEQYLKDESVKQPRNFKKVNEAFAKNFMKDGAELKRIWISQRDHRVRRTHVILDGQAADDNSLFHSKPTASYGYAPRLMMGINALQENIGCRCSVGYRINGIELDQLDADTMSIEHAEIYERTSFDNYQDWLKEHKSSIKPEYYNQLSKRMNWYKTKTHEETEVDLIKDSERFSKMLERGFHKKADGSWGY